MNRRGYENLIAGVHSSRKTNVDRVIDEIIGQFDHGYGNDHDDRHGFTHVVNQIDRIRQELNDYLDAQVVRQPDEEDQAIKKYLAQIAAVAIRAMDLVDRIEEQSYRDAYPSIGEIIT